MAPVGEQLVAVGALAEGGPRSKYVQHFKLLAEAAQGLTWVVYTGPACGGWLGRGGTEPAALESNFLGMQRRMLMARALLCVLGGLQAATERVGVCLAS